ncbi:cytochrome P450 alkane hydroxylase-like protein [Corynespora cassiicola Philippines]|uniref:Cytochrome P450 alkane hydroxylase-like protein n=1 Tax=Corynespora cassiicola Philippines TaxID=1448308 RepID=A0A2T2NFY7_CORCC|nr:cytochrome P450 alkane hydroxylase-like protein [Corynespora cassiicola Philippines]
MIDVVRPYLSTPNLLSVSLVLYIVYKIVYTVQQNVKIRRLGARAPVRKTYLPFGIDMVYNVVTHALADQNYQMWLKMFKKFGKGGYTLEAGVGGERLILTAEPDNIKAILATQFKDYGKGESFRLDWHPFLGNGIFTTDGSLWHDSRQLIRPQFIKDRVSDLHIFEEHLQVLFQKFDETRVVDTLDLMFRFTLDAATHFLLGKSVESLHHPQVAFADAFYIAQRVQSIVARVGKFNWLVPRRQMGFYKSIKIIDDFVNQYIETALALSPKELEEKSNHDEGYTFLHAIAGYTRDRKVLRDQLVSVLLAGRDTTACTLTWTLYELSKQPHIMAKLRKEIVDRIGTERPPQYQDLKEMKYLQHIMNETLRLYPVVPFNVRMSLSDTTLPTGGGPDGKQPIGILKNTPIGYSTLVMQRRADLYPPPESGFPDVDKFVPERWDGWTPASWTYVPFNGGPRICIGQQFALTEMGYTLVRLFQRYETIHNMMGGEDPGLHMDIVLQPAKEVKLAFVKAPVA